MYKPNHSVGSLKELQLTNLAHQLLLDLWIQENQHSSTSSHYTRREGSSHTCPMVLSCGQRQTWGGESDIWAWVAARAHVWAHGSAETSVCTNVPTSRPHPRTVQNCLCPLTGYNTIENYYCPLPAEELRREGATSYLSSTVELTLFAGARDIWHWGHGKGHACHEGRNRCLLLLLTTCVRWGTWPNFSPAAALRRMGSLYLLGQYNRVDPEDRGMGEPALSVWEGHSWCYLIWPRNAGGDNVERCPPLCPHCLHLVRNLFGQQNTADPVDVDTAEAGQECKQGRPGLPSICHMAA